MTKREMIDEILAINVSAEPQFLARFADDQLFEYMTHLRVLSTPRLTGNADRYEKYFRNLPRIAANRPQWRCDTQIAQVISADEQAGLTCQAEPANDAQPETPAGTLDDYPAAEPATEAHATPEAAQADEAPCAERVPFRELVAQDVDLAVGQAEREQLLSIPAELDDAQDDDDDDPVMEAPFKIATSRRRTSSARTAASNAAKHMLYGADTPQPPPRPRRRATSSVSAAIAVAPQAGQSDPDDLDDEKWPY